MEPETYTALLSLCGTMLGSLGGILTSSKLTTWRIQQLEKKVEKHNTLIERMTRAESDISNLKAEVYHEAEVYHD